jgi:hypothetical protein
VASIQYVVGAVDASSSVFAKIAASADGLDKQLEDLGKRVADPEVNLKDSKFTLGIVRAAERLDKLNAMVADPEVTVDTAKAQTEILRINAMLDRLDAKRVDVAVGVHRGVLSRIGGGIGGLFGAGAGAASGAGPAGGSALAGLGALGPYAGGAAIGIGGVVAAALAPSGIATLLGGGLGILGAYLTMGNKLSKVFSEAFGALKQDLVPLKPLFTSVFEGLAGFVKSIGPQLRDMFRASVPFLRMFVQLGEQAAKLILPVITQMLKQMAPFLPLISKGLLAVVQGFASMLKAMGPQGFRDSARIFMNLCKVMGFTLTILGKAINFTAVAVYDTAHKIHQWWDWLRHATDDVFTGIRHDLAHWWDVIYSDTIGVVIRLDKGIIGFFQRLPGQAVHALFGLGHSLAAFMRAAWNEMWAAARNVGGSILHWVTSWASNLWHGLLHFFHIGSPSGLFYDIGKNLMLGLRNGIQDHIRHASGAARMAAAAVASSGARTGSAAVEQRYAAGLLGSYGWPGGEMGPLVALWNRESGWNPYAVNPSSGAYGIPQSLGHGHPYNLGDYKAQIIWGLNYIAGRYGSPGAAWAHELQFGWYDRGGWLPPGVSLAANFTGRPERVGGGNTYTVNVNVPPTANLREAGRVTVEAIKAYEQGSGARWRS